MLGERRRRRRDDRPRLPARRRLPHGPVRADRPDRARRQPQRRPLLLRPGRRARALAAQSDPGTRWSPRAGSAARAAAASTTTTKGAPPRARTRELGIEAPTLDADELARIDPAAPEILPRLVAQIANEAAFALEEGVGSPADMDTAMRLGFNWPLGPLELDRADRRGAGRSQLLEELREPSTGEPTGPAAAADRAPQRREPRRARCRATRTSRRRAAAWSRPSTRRWSRTRTAAPSGTCESYEFLDGEPPDTANPSLWRQSQLTRIAGLFELAPGFYQLRGFDLSNMHVVEGDEGIVVIDPLISAETAAAALALYREHRGERPGHRPRLHPQPRRPLRRRPRRRLRRGGRGARHPGPRPRRLPPPRGQRERLRRHGDGPARRLHVRGAARARRRRPARLRPRTDHLARHDHPDPAQPRHRRDRPGGDRRRGADALPADPGDRGAGRDEHPLPRRARPLRRRQRARSMHNILTPRGALVRDPRVWAHYLDEAIELFGADSDVLFAGHHWPAWGGERIVDFLEKQRDLYAYLHDQTLRLLNKGLTGPEIAEQIELPPSLAAEWHCREYYGSVSHNVKAIYQRYMGWFDGNPAHLWEHPPVEQARRYVEFMGGAEAVLEKARAIVRGGRLPLGRRGRQPRRLRRARERGGARAAGRRARAARLRRRERDLAQLLPDGREGAARGHLRDADRRPLPRRRRPPHGRASCSTRWRSALDGPRAWEQPPADRLGGHRPRRAARDHAFATASSATGPAATSPTPTRPWSSSARRSTSCC